MPFNTKSKLNIDEPFKAIKVINFLFLFLHNRHHITLVISLFACLALKAASESDADLTVSYWHADPLQVYY